MPGLFRIVMWQFKVGGIMAGSLDKEKFVKLLGLLTSNQDGEVLAAAKKSNEALKAAGLTWSEVFAFSDNPQFEGALAYVDARSAKLDAPTRETFNKIREKYFTNMVDEKEQRRVVYLKKFLEERAKYEKETEIPF